MSFPFNPKQGLIIIRAEFFGPSGSNILRLALDTDATGTLVNIGMLVAIGYDPALTANRIQVTTGSGVEYAPLITVDQIITLGQERINFPVLCHTLPPSASVDGLLGLDFLRDQYLTIDFRSGQLKLV